MKLNSKMNMYSNFSMMWGGNKYPGALHLSPLSIGFLLQIFGGSAATFKNESYGITKYGEFKNLLQILCKSYNCKSHLSYKTMKCSRFKFKCFIKLPMVSRKVIGSNDTPTSKQIARIENDCR